MSEVYSQRFRMHTMPKAQCHVHIAIYDDGVQVDLISYSTFVCRARLIDDTLTLECTGTHSVTTSRHINRFTTEFFGRSLYYECKASTEKEFAYVSKDPDEIAHFEKVMFNYINNTFYDWNVVKYNWRY